MRPAAQGDNRRRAPWALAFGTDSSQPATLRTLTRAWSWRRPVSEVVFYSMNGVISAQRK